MISKFVYGHINYVRKVNAVIVGNPCAIAGCRYSEHGFVVTDMENFKESVKMFHITSGKIYNIYVVLYNAETKGLYGGDYTDEHLILLSQ